MEIEEAINLAGRLGSGIAFFVRKDFRRRGISRMLFQGMTKTLEGKPYDMIRLTVLGLNDVAINV